MKNYVKRISLSLGFAALSYAQTTTAPIYTMSIVAGIPTGNSLGDGGPSTFGIVASPQGIAVDANGNIYIADGTNSRIRKIDATTGNISTFTNSNISSPAGMAFDPQGNLWVANPGNHTVARVSPDGKTSTQMVHNGVTNTFGGDNNYAIDAYFNGIGGVAIDKAGDVFIADTGNNRVRELKNVNNCINTPVTINGVSKPHSCTVITIAGGSLAPQYNAGINATTGLPNDPRVTSQCGSTTGNLNYCQPDGTNTNGDGGPALLAHLSAPYGIAVTPDGSKVYVSAQGDSRIRVIDMTTGLISSLIGNCVSSTSSSNNAGAGNPYVVPCPSGSFGSATANGVAGGVGTLGDGKLASQATTNGPRGLYLDSTNNILYFADTGNNRIRAINLSTGIVNTVVGGGSTTTDAGTSLNSGLLTSASLNAPYGVWVANGLIYWTEQGSNKARVADPVAQKVTTLVNTARSTGSGAPATQAYLGFASTFASTASPRVGVDPAGNVYIVEASLNKIRKLTPDGIINDWAGTGIAGSNGDGGPAVAARLSSPQQISFDTAGNAYIADTGNSKIRKVDTNGVITTVVGRAQVTSCSATVTAAGQCSVDKSNYVGDGGAPSSAVLSSPQGVTVDKLGNLIIADTGHSAIRYADLTNNIITTIGGGVPAGTIDGPTDGRSGLGNQTGLFDSTNSLYALLNNPRGIAVDNNGVIYIADYSNAAVRDMIPNGNIGQYGLYTFYGSGSSSGTAPGIPTGTGTATVPARIRMSSGNATSIAVDSGNNIYIAEAADSRVVVVSADHTKVYQVAGGGSNDTGSNYTSSNGFNLEVPAVSGVAVDSNGVVYTADRTGVVRKLVCTANCLPLK